MRSHPIAEIFPLMAPAELSDLANDIKTHGQREPVWLYEGAILDGRNRWSACEIAGVECRTLEYEGDDPLGFVLSLNLHRRQMTASQRAVVALKIEPFEAARARERQEAGANQHRSLVEIVPQGSDPGKARDKAAAAVGANPRYVQDAKKVAEVAPDLINEVAAGNVTIPQAMRQIAEARRAADLVRPVRVSVVGLQRGDFRDLACAIPDESVELVFTDPPYDRASLPLYEAAAREAARILKPGGSMICYVGQVLLPDALSLMSRHLRYWWTAACVHEGGNQMMQKLGIRCGWKPMLWFVKGTRGDVSAVIRDTVSGDREKHSHEWQQAEADAEHFIRGLTSARGMVVDFFAGGGTTCVVAERLGRPWAAFEFDARHYEAAAKRITGGRRDAA